MPPSFLGWFDRVDGGTLIGRGGVLELWSTASNLALWREDYRAFRSTPMARVVFFGSDGGGFESFFDVDDHFGCGRYAVLQADRSSDTTEFVAPTFYTALERIIEGPKRTDVDVVAVARPAGSERR